MNVIDCMLESKVTSSQFQEYLVGVTYPIDKGELLSIAREHGAPQGILEELDKRPEEEYLGEGDVIKAVQGVTISNGLDEPDAS